MEATADEVMTIPKRNIVILGRTGTGKKSIANQILDKQYFNVGSSMESVTRDASTEDVDVINEKRKVHYDIKIIDTVGPYSTVVDKKTIFNQIKDYSINKVPEGVNLIIFTLRKDVYNIAEEIEVFKTILKEFKDDIREISALVITGCEGLNELGRQSVIQEIKTDPNTKQIANFMEKGIHPVGFPPLQNTTQVMKEALEQGMASDAERLRELVLDARATILQQDIPSQKLQSMNHTGRSEKRSDKFEYPGSASLKQCKMEATADKVTIIQKRNIVILGRIGTGKKSIANQILDKQYFNFESSMESVTRDTNTEDVDVTDEKRKVRYKIKIIDTVGPYSTVVDKKTIFNQIKDYSKNKVPEGVNLIIFTLRKDVYNIAEEIEVFKTILKEFKDDIREISALVITGCEGLHESGRQSVIQKIKIDPNTRHIANFMAKGIHPVGFPPLQNTTPVMKETLEQGMASDAERLRELVLGAGVMILQQDILRRKLHSMEYTGRSEKSSEKPEYPGSAWKQCSIL